MRWLVTGAGGMLGGEIVAQLHVMGHEVAGLARGELDVTDSRAVAKLVAGSDVVVNCAAWTAVDDAETHEAIAFNTNAMAPALLARAARGAGARLVQISTDYVFDGKARRPYGEAAALQPASAYGRSKAAGEWAVRAETADFLIVRTAWLYGAGGGCFPKTIARLASHGGPLRVVGDQVGQPTWTRDLADLLIRLVTAGTRSGIYHGTASGQVSWHGFASEILTTLGAELATVDEVGSSEFPRPAQRPAYSVLSHNALTEQGVEPIGDWRERWHAAADTVLGA